MYFKLLNSWHLLVSGWYYNLRIILGECNILYFHKLKKNSLKIHIKVWQLRFIECLQFAEGFPCLPSFNAHSNLLRGQYGSQCTDEETDLEIFSSLPKVTQLRSGRILLIPDCAFLNKFNQIIVLEKFNSISSSKLSDTMTL